MQGRKERTASAGPQRKGRKKGPPVKSREEKATSSEPQGKGHPVKGRKERANQCWPAKKGPPVQCRKERATSAPTACDHMKMEEELGFVCAAICFALTVVFVR